MNKTLSLFRKLCLATLLLTFTLIILGGVVHNTGSSLACPDWPLCFGSVMPAMEGGVAIEHSHRLLASLVGLLTIGLVLISAKLRRENPRLFSLSLLALLLVVLQGLLGGLTVLLKLSPLVSTAHLALSQLFFGTLALLLYRTRASRRGSGADPLIRRKLNIALVALYVQMLLGAFIRHGGAAVACGLGSEALFLCIDPASGSASLLPSWGPAFTHMLHRLGGFIVMGLVIWSTIPAIKWGRRAGDKPTRLMSVGTHILVSFQIILGFLTIYTYIGRISVTLHLAVAALLLVDLLWLRLRIGEASSSTSPAYRSFSP
jgi:heme A synthase